MRPHFCDDRCVCPVDQLPLLYARSTDEHACVNVDCENGHGLRDYGMAPYLRRVQ